MHKKVVFYKILLPVLILLIFSLEALASDSRYYFLRLSQNEEISGTDFGHCSSVYDSIKKVIYTAAHCYHDKNFQIRDKNGQHLFTLKDATYSYLENENGLLDVFLISDFGEISKTLLNQKADKVEDISMQNNFWYILGYPSKYNKDPLTQFVCSELIISQPLFMLEMERLLKTIHLTCPTYRVGDDLYSNNLEYSETAGVSGGGVFKSGELVGIIYHIGENKEEFGIYYKIQKIKDINLQPVSVENAKNRYQLNTKSLEQVKVPNVYKNELNMLFLSKLFIFDNRQNHISKVYWNSNQNLVFEFIGFESIEVKKEQLSIRLLKFFESNLIKL